MRAAYFLLFFPYPGWIWVISLQMCAEVEVPSLNPVWYILVYSKWGASAATLAMMAFSMIFATWDLTTIGRISLSSAWSLPLFLDKGTSLPSYRYLGIY